jgi:hypothetical protein
MQQQLGTGKQQVWCTFDSQCARWSSGVLSGVSCCGSCCVLAAKFQADLNMLCCLGSE